MPEKRRVDIRRILADPELRRELMIATVQATQAREGIETTTEQAERAYYVVTEGERSAFFDLDRFRTAKGQSDTRHEVFTRALADGTRRIRFDVPRRDFAAIEGAPLAYQRVGLVSHIFREAPPLDPTFTSVTSGLMTVQSDRITRFHWEIPSSFRSFLSGWSRFAKGGEFSRFFRDVDLLVDLGPRSLPLLEREGALRNRSLYGREGLTWVPRTQRGFNVQHLPPDTVFGKKGPIILPKDPVDLWWLLGLLNSSLVEYVLHGLMSFGSYEVGVLRKLPVPMPTPSYAERLAEHARLIHDSKAEWDEGNETSTRFRAPWLLGGGVAKATMSISSRLDHLAEHETSEEARIREAYAELNNEVFKVYEIPDGTRDIIEGTLGERPPELLWPQMQGKSAEQKRIEHVFRLLSHVVKRVVTASEDGIVPFSSVDGEPDLVTRLHFQLAALFPDRDAGLVEAEVANELRKNVSGYRRTAGIGEWLRNAFFEFHRSLYKNTPVIWHFASSRGTAPFAFGALVDYHRFDRTSIAKLRSHYLREAIESFRREAAMADKERNTEARLEWQTRLEETLNFDRRLQWVEEGYHEGREGGPHDYRILTPWKSAKDRPKGWDPDLDDGVQVNIASLYKAGVLRLDG
jgi:hypothetical protein